jgi:gas vesicle protein
MRTNRAYGADNENAGTGMSGIGMLLGGIGIGAALMYLFDPERGRGRRARLSDQWASKVNRLGAAAESKARDLKNRAQGVMHEASSVLPGIVGSEQAESNQTREQPDQEGATRARAATGQTA